MIKTNGDGTMSGAYDNATLNSVFDNVVSSYSTVCSTSAAISALEDTVKEITKKPDVRVEQRSALEISNRVVAKFYKDGFFTDSKYLIPAIKSIDVFNENTIKMTFVNGDVQTVTVQNGDPYFFEDGLLRCIVKEMIGKEGTAILSKLLSYATKVYKNAEADKKKTAEEDEKKRIAAEKNYKKAKKHWAKKRAMERENRIQELAEAIIRAKEMAKK